MNEYDSNRIYDLTATIGFDKYFFMQFFYFLVFEPYNSNLWSTSL